MHSTFASLLRRLRRVTTPAQKRHFVWLCVLQTVMGFVEMAVAGSVSLLGVAMASPHSITEQIPLMAQFANLLPLAPTVGQQLRVLLLVMLFVALAVCCKNAMLAFVTWQQNRFGQVLAWAAGGRLFQALLRAPWLWHTRQNSALLITTMAWRIQVSALCTNMLTLLTQAVIGIFLFTGALIADPLFSLLLFGLITVFAYAIHRFSRQRLAALAGQLVQYDLTVSRTIMQGLHGLRECRIYAQEANFHEAYTAIATPYTAKASVRDLYPPLPSWVLESAGMLLLLAVLLGLILTGTGVARTTGLLTLLAAISWRLLPAANKAIGAIMGIRITAPYVEKFFNTLEEAESIAVNTGLRQALPFKESIALHKASFTYPGTTQPALVGIDLTIRKGQMLGIVGLSGSGKSTLTGIITGLLESQEGSLTVDGQAFDPMRQRLNLGYVPQQLYLLDASLAENVAFSHWGEAIDEALVRECCRMAAMDFVDELPEGIHTVLGERGVRLSGGQVQRVGIARALYDMPDILFFDEATSALDGAAEAEIQQTITSLKSNITLVIVAHRLSTVRDCDHLVWLDKGRVMMQGDAASVLAEYEKYLRKDGKC